MPESSVAHARARLAAHTRHQPRADHSEARRALAAANLEAYIRRVVAAAPPLTSEQREKLAMLLSAPPSQDGVAA